MPCRDGYGESSYYEILEQERQAKMKQERLDLATRVACELGKVFRRKVYGWKNEISKETADWLNKHDEADRLRLKREREEKERYAKAVADQLEKKRLREHARSKLTEAERKALGL